MNAEEERQDDLSTFTLTNLRSPSSQSFTQSMNAEEERQDHLPAFATTTESPSSTSRQDHPPTLATTIESPSSTSRQDHLPTLVITTKSVPSTSVLTWLNQLRAPPPRPSTSPPTSALFEGIQTRSRKRNQSLASPLLEGMQTRSRQRKRSLTSTPSELLGDGPAFRKKQKFGPELDVDMVTSPTHLSTPTSEEASLSRIEPLPSSITSTAMSGSDPQSPVPSKTVVDTETYSRLLNMAMRLHKLEVRAQLIRDVKDFFEACLQYLAAERALIRKTGTYSKAYSQQRLAELAIQEIQLIGEVEAYIKAYRQQHAAEQ